MPVRSEENFSDFLRNQENENHSNFTSYQDEIVISGFSGRLPESSTIEEFKNNLFNGIDMVNDDPRRWPTGMHDLPLRIGKIKQEDLENFDATFFGVHQKQTEKMDPVGRMLLEATYEAIIDSGYNPQDLRGSRTGVYVGVIGSEAEEYWYSDPDLIDGYALTGCARSMFANRLSFTFDFHGPSYIVDTACSSSLFAMVQAFQDLRAGRCDAAIVAGANIILRPMLSLEATRMKMLSPDGTCKAFDQSANGFVRSDGCVVTFLQKAKDARRVYATILNIRSNTDGSKEEGITYPNGSVQKKLIEETFSEINLNPRDVVYVEAHGTGTKAGDPQEVNTICDVFCKDRTTPLLIGSVKSNIGHSEPASGVASVAKMLIAMEENVIPGNLHYKKPNPEICGLLDGRLSVVDKNTPWDGGIIAINNFGFGGVNVHAILKSNPKPKYKRTMDKLPRLVLVSGRTEEAVETLLDDIEAHADDEEYLALINEIHTKNINRHNFRGYIVLSQDEPVHDVIELSETKRPIWFVYSGMGSQWTHMVKDLMQIDIFNKSIHRCAEALHPEGINLIDIVTNFGEFDILDSFVAIAAMQIALTDVLTHLGIIPDGIVGHSVGELGCAYADECFTLEQTILAAYWRGKSILDAKLMPGMMIAVGLPWEECVKRLPKDIFPACNNSADNVSVSGPPDSVSKFFENLNREGIFTRVVNSSGAAFHSKYMADVSPKLKKSLYKLIPNPKNRSEKWISSSVPENKWNTPLAKQSSAEYHVNNLLSPVLFYEAIQHIPDNAICIEVSPHGILQAILKRSLGKNVTNLSLVKRNHESNFQFLLSNIGKFYGSGGQPIVKKLFRQVSFPVGRGTPMLNSRIGWDHSQKYIVPYYGGRNLSGQSTVSFNLSNEEDAFLAGNVIDGQVIFPATGYIVLAWRHFARNFGSTNDSLPVILENLIFHNTSSLTEDEPLKLGIIFFNVSGKFQICEGNTLVMSGTIRIAENINREEVSLDPVQESIGLPLESNDIYKEFRLRGYDFTGSFCSIIQTDALRTTGKLEWLNKNWVCFIDAMLQLKLLGIKERDLCIPTRIEKIIINPEKHLKLAAVSGNEQNAILSANFYKDINVIKSSGIEIHGLTVSRIPRRQNSQAAPILERYTFIPNYNTDNLSVDTDLARNHAITSIVQLSIENNKGSMRMKTIEFLLNRDPKSSLSKIVKQIIDNEPKLGSDATIVADEKTSILEQYANETQMRIIYEDITKRSLQPGYHLCIAANVLSRPDVAIILKNLKYSIGDEGFILLEEDITENDKQDNNKVFKTLNLVIVSSQICNKKKYLLLRPEFEIKSQNIQVVNVTDKNFDWIDDIKLAIATAENKKKLVYIVCQGEELFGAIGFMTCLKYEVGGNYARLFFIQDTNAPEFSFSNHVYMKQISKNLIINVLKNGVWGTFRHFLLENQQNSMSTMKQVENACVNVLTKGDLTSLRWIERPPTQDNPNLNNPGFRLYTVYCASLNFRDIMLSTGKISTDTLVEKVAQQECVLGVEFSGRDLEGNRVMAIVSSLSLATTVAARKELVWRVPDYWTLEQASSIPMAYSTAYYALVMKGKMKKGETILIHAGSGGVGQAAIRVALSAGLTVYTTVGSKEKREFLKETFPQLTDQHIGNSRDCSFKQMIMHETKGKGVDLVLISLVDDKFQESVKCLGSNGPFLEIGKFDISNNSSLGMAILRKNTSFHGIFIDHVMNSDDEELHEISQLLKDGISKGVVQPLPTTVFEKHQLEEAFRFMAASKHIGKVVIKVREEEEQKQIIPTKKLISAIPRTYLHKEKTYVIVGGLGGFGLELIHWLVLRGARKIVATSRNGIKTGYQHLMVRRWQEKGVNVIIEKNDITTEESAHQLLQKANNIGHVGGIFNLAAVFCDAYINDLQKDDFIRICRPKVCGTKFLDAASRILCPKLDYFICFSSSSCGRGNIGQVNYGLANSAMERICEARQTAGYPGTAIQWGPVGDTGIVLEILGNNNTITNGSLPQRMVSCLKALDLFMQQPHPVLASMVVAEKGINDSLGQVSLAVCIGKILGFKDIKKISDSSTLFDLGMDSLMGNEIKQTLERNYDIVMNIQEIRQLMFGQLKEFGR